LNVKASPPDGNASPPAELLVDLVVVQRILDRGIRGDVVADRQEESRALLADGRAAFDLAADPRPMSVHKSPNSPQAISVDHQKS
jgi:hypothetical protein